MARMIIDGCGRSSVLEQDQDHSYSLISRKKRASLWNVTDYRKRHQKFRTRRDVAGCTVRLSCQVVSSYRMPSQETRAVDVVIIDDSGGCLVHPRLSKRDTHYPPCSAFLQTETRGRSRSRNEGQHSYRHLCFSGNMRHACGRRSVLSLPDLKWERHGPRTGLDPRWNRKQVTKRTLRS